MQYTKDSHSFEYKYKDEPIKRHFLLMPKEVEEFYRLQKELEWDPLKAFERVAAKSTDNLEYFELIQTFNVWKGRPS